MSFEKISSEVTQECPPIQSGDTIYWHFATFEDLMTEKSRILNTSFLTGMESGIAGTYPPNHRSKWLLWEVLREKCYLGEKSIWKWSEKSKDIVCFVEIVQQNKIPSATLNKSEIAVAKVASFKNQARIEVELLEWSGEKPKFSEEEVFEYSCVCFRDYWVDQDSALPDTAFSSGEFGRILIRRGYIQGWWALALRQLGTLLRFRMENREFWELRKRE